MSAATYIYLIDILKSLGLFLQIISFLLFIGAGLITLFIHTDMKDDDDIQRYSSIRNKCFIAAIFLSLIAIFIPEEKTMYMMIGASYLQKSSIPSKVEKVINDKLDHYLAESDKANEKN